MAMIKTDGRIVDIEGKMGGNIYRHDQCLNHIQAHPRIIHSEERANSPQAKGFRQSKNAWISHKWTQEELNQWWVWCYNHPKKNKKSETVYFHPFLAFLSVNIKRVKKGLCITITPPH
ncbi:unnamed protein product [marine sediment metagenome]|uniref:Uncharacterized protein n=1 Tax=marine sediment metagenome TaxID=412755 RepID=X1GCN1_9ZZZZ